MDTIGHTGTLGVFGHVDLDESESPTWVDWCNTGSGAHWEATFLGNWGPTGALGLATLGLPADTPGWTSVGNSVTGELHEHESVCTAVLTMGMDVMVG